MCGKFIKQGAQRQGPMCRRIKTLFENFLEESRREYPASCFYGYYYFSSAEWANLQHSGRFGFPPDLNE